MKNKLYTVIGGKWIDNKECSGWENPEDMNYVAFKNKEKAIAYKEKLLDEFMKTKCYSHNYTIGEVYKDEERIIDTYITCISNKKGYIVYCTEFQEIDLANVVM